MTAPAPPGEWTFGVGDPTVLGWTITFAYAAVAWLALRAASRAARPQASRVSSRSFSPNRPLGNEGVVRFWCFMAFMLAVLCVNKQLDLQRLLTEVAREIAKSGGWYRERKPLQVAVLMVLLLVVLGTSAWTAWILRRHLRVVWPALAGVLVIAAFVAMRATSHHDVDAFMRAGPLPLRDSMELVGVSLIAWSALWHARADFWADS